MSNHTSLYLWNEQLQDGTARHLQLVWNITAAKTASLARPQSAVLSSFDAITQAKIDALLGSSGEFTAAQFDSTAMGTDAFAAIVDFGGQCRHLVRAEIRTLSGTGGGTVVVRNTADSGLTDSTLATEASKSAAGNVAVRAVLTGVDALTAGQIVLDLWFISK